MCSVVGYIGKQSARVSIIEGLLRLEYRGYDSAGFACINPHSTELQYLKTPGRVENLQKLVENYPIDGNVAVGHTRWSTHGVASAVNAHPQLDCHTRIAVVHNGIVENHHEVKAQLATAGHFFCSETDTEVIAHLLEQHQQQSPSWQQAVQCTVNQLQGAYAFLALSSDHPHYLVAVRKRSPLCIGVGDGEFFVASDPLAFAGKTNRVIFMPDETYAMLTKTVVDGTVVTSVELFAFDGTPVRHVVQEVQLAVMNHDKKQYEHFMLQEIYEQKSSIAQTVAALRAQSGDVWQHLGITAQQAKEVTSFNLVGSGTSWHAARIAQFFFETIALTPTRALLASEFRYMPFFPDLGGLYLMVSQSGETADTLEALKMVQTVPVATATITNVASSTMVREAGGFLLTHAGHEVAVASTKAFSCQVALLYWLAHRLAVEKGVIAPARMAVAEEALLGAAQLLESCIDQYREVITTTYAPRYAQADRAIFLGRHINYPFALEAALKLKEISYIFAQGYPAGELKHGPLALVDAQTPVFIFSHTDAVMYQKLVANAQEVKARGGHLIVFAFEGQHELCLLGDAVFTFPLVEPLLMPLVMTGVMQFLMYQIAKELDRPIDKPRNLAKSVTVE